MTKLDWAGMPWEQVRTGVERKLCNGEKSTVAMHRVGRSAVTAAHAHAEEQTVYLLAGRLRYDVGDQAIELGAGEILVIPSGVVHRSETISEEPAVSIDVFVPRRSY